MPKWLNAIFKGSDIFLWIILIVLIMILVGAVVFLIVQLFKFKHRLVIRNVASNRKYIEFDKFKVVKDDDGVVWWKLLKRKQLIPVAPAEAIEISKKGAMVVEAYYTDEGEYIYQTDEINAKHFDDIHGAVYVAERVNKKKYDDILKNYKEKLLDYKSMSFLNKLLRLFKKPKKPKTPDEVGRYVYIKDKNKTIEGFDPFTTEQRLILVNQYKKAAQRKKFKWYEHLPQLVAIGALVLLVLIMFMFWDNITKPSIEAIDKWDVAIAKQDHMLDTIQEILQKKQILQEEGTQKATDAPN